MSVPTAVEPEAQLKESVVPERVLHAAKQWLSGFGPDVRLGMPDDHLPTTKGTMWTFPVHIIDQDGADHLHFVDQIRFNGNGNLLSAPNMEELKGIVARIRGRKRQILPRIGKVLEFP